MQLYTCTNIINPIILSRVFWGRLCDKFGYKPCMMFITVAIAVLYSTLIFVPVGGKVFFATWVWAIFFAFCANFVLLPTATAQGHSSSEF